MSGSISIRIPVSYHQAVQEVAKAEHVSMNQWIASAIGEKLSAVATEDYIQKRAARASRKKFDQALGNVPDVEPDLRDSLSV